MNDPNGLVYFEEEYHLFYQWTPEGGKQHWGHAVSPDLLRWQDLEVALAPDELGSIWSGSAVVDENDASGFFGGRPGLIAAYTNQNHETPPHGPQAQSIAYSADRGRTWTKHQGNPVAPNPGIPDFRDPKVFWHATTARWIMILAAGCHAEIWTSRDLKEWAHASSFGAAQGTPECVWECPDLFELPIENEPGQSRWVLAGSPIMPACYPLESTRTWCFVGAFDGTTFISETPALEPLWVDYGRDNYASVTWANAPGGRALWIGWMSDWDWTFQVPTQGWRSAMTLPRELTLRRTSGKLQFIQRPIREIESVRTSIWEMSDVCLAPGEDPWGHVQGVALDISLEFEPGDASEVGVRVRVGSSEQTTIGYDAAAGRLFVDRTRSGQCDFHPRFSERHDAPLPARNGQISLRILVDACSVEVFADDGALVMTDLIFPAAASRGLSLYSKDGACRIAHARISEVSRTVERPAHAESPAAGCDRQNP